LNSIEQEHQKILDKQLAGAYEELDGKYMIDMSGWCESDVFSICKIMRQINQLLSAGAARPKQKEED
jgi:hypothetical protein